MGAVSWQRTVLPVWEPPVQQAAWYCLPSKPHLPQLEESGVCGCLARGTVWGTHWAWDPGLLCIDPWAHCCVV